MESQKISPSQELLSLQIRTLFLQILILSREDSDTPVNHVMQYINLHITENISLDVLAEQEHISKSYLVKQFKEKTGTTIISYQHEIRLNHVKRLLVTTTKSVEEIALETGFDSPKYLYRLFKTQEGLSPSAYRRLYLTEHDDSIIN